jgi:hypothetical protein
MGIFRLKKGINAYSFFSKVFIFALPEAKYPFRYNMSTSFSVKFIPIHRFMQKTFSVKNLAILLSCAVLLASCKEKAFSAKTNTINPM